MMNVNAMTPNTVYDIVAEIYVTILAPCDSPATFHTRLVTHVINVYPNAVYIATDDMTTTVLDEHHNYITTFTANC